MSTLLLPLACTGDDAVRGGASEAPQDTGAPGDVDTGDTGDTQDPVDTGDPGDTDEPRDTDEPCPDGVTCVDRLPYTDSATTTGAASDWDSYACAASTDELTRPIAACRPGWRPSCGTSFAVVDRSTDSCA